MPNAGLLLFGAFVVLPLVGLIAASFNVRTRPLPVNLAWAAAAVAAFTMARLQAGRLPYGATWPVELILYAETVMWALLVIALATARRGLAPNQTRERVRPTYQLEQTLRNHEPSQRAADRPAE